MILEIALKKLLLPRFSKICFDAFQISAGNISVWTKWRTHWQTWTWLSSICAKLYKTFCTLQDGWGTDFRKNMSVNLEDYGKYATDVFTEEALKVFKTHDTSKPLFLYLAHLGKIYSNDWTWLQTVQLTNPFSIFSCSFRKHIFTLASPEGNCGCL